MVKEEPEEFRVFLLQSLMVKEKPRVSSGGFAAKFDGKGRVRRIQWCFYRKV